MTCDEIQERLSAFADGELSPDLQSPMFQHLAGCATCRAAFADLLEVRMSLQAAPTPAAPVELDRRVFGRIRGSAMRHDRPPIWIRRRIALPVPVALGVGLLLIAATLLLGPQVRSSSNIVYVQVLPEVEVVAPH